MCLAASSRRSRLYLSSVGCSSRSSTSCIERAPLLSATPATWANSALDTMRKTWRPASRRPWQRVNLFWQLSNQPWPWWSTSRESVSIWKRRNTVIVPRRLSEWKSQEPSFHWQSYKEVGEVRWRQELLKWFTLTKWPHHSWMCAFGHCQWLLTSTLVIHRGD